MIDNSPEKIKLRRSQNTLRIVGTGTMAFGIWSLVKTFVFFILDRNQAIAELRSRISIWTGVIPDREQLESLLLFMAAGFLLLDIIARLYVGSSALLESRGRKRSRLYVVIAFLMICNSLATQVMIFFTSGEASETSGNQFFTPMDGSVSSIVIELTSMVMLVEMVVASVMVRKLTGQQRKS